MLILWAGSEPGIFSSVVGPTISYLGVPHKVVPITGQLPEAGPDDVILAFGNKALDVLKSLKYFKPSTKIGALRGTPHTCGGLKVFLTFDPGLTQVEYERKPDIIWDATLAARYAVSGSLEAQLGSYKYVSDFTTAVAFVEAEYAHTGKPVPISCDLETVGFDPFPKDKFIVSISFTYKSGMADMMRFQGPHHVPAKNSKLWDQIYFLLNSDHVKVRGANFKFDMLWLAEKWGMTADSFVFDTTLVGSLLDENRSNSLEMHTKVQVPSLGGYDTLMNTKYDKSRMDLVPDKDLLTYGGGDTDATYQVAERFRQELLKDSKLTNFYVNVLHPASMVFSKLERRGVLVDIEEYDKLEGEVASEIHRLGKEILGLIPRKLQLKYSDNLKLSRPALLRDFMFTPHGLNLKPQMFTEKSKEPSTSIEHFELFQDVPEAKKFVELLGEYNSATKTMSTYIIGFRKHLRVDGKFHPTYLLFKGAYGDSGGEAGTNTGRTSCRDPAWQTLPKHSKWAKALRRVYPAPPGYSILKLDYSQGELRIAAILANEPTMLDAYFKGQDLHAKTAAGQVGKTLEEFMALPDEEREELRFLAKAINFGLIYGMGAEGFVLYARANYGVAMPLSKGVETRDKFFALYSKLLAWHKRYKEFAKKNGFVRSPLGRIRHLPLITSYNKEVRAQQERRAVNSPVQSTLSDMMELAMVELDRLYPELQMWGMTHDDLALYVPIGEEILWATRCKEVMENLPLDKLFGWNPPIKFIVDAEAGPNLAEVSKLLIAA